MKEFRARIDHPATHRRHDGNPREVTYVERSTLRAALAFVTHAQRGTRVTVEQREIGEWEPIPEEDQ